MKKTIPLLSILVMALSSCSFVEGFVEGVNKDNSRNSTSDTSLNTDSGSTNTGTSSDSSTSSAGSSQDSESSNNDSTTSDTSSTSTTDTSTTSSSDTSTTTSTSSDTSTTHRSGVVSVKFAGINDFHGHIEEEGDMVGLAKMSTYIKSKKSEGAIFCNSGDMWQETFLSSECRGTIISKAFRNAGVDVNTLGNHDFDWGVGAIRLNEQAEYFNEATLGANIMSYPKTGSSWTKSDLGKEYKTFVINKGTDQEVKIGVVGIIGKDQLTSITSKYVQDYVFVDHNDTIKNVATKLRQQEKCDIVVASCHTPANQLDDSLFELDGNGKRKYIDGAFTAHDHAMYADTVYNAPVLEAQSYGRYGSEFTLAFNLDSGKVEQVQYENVKLANLSLKEDAAVKTEVDALVAECDKKGNTEYGSVTGTFSKSNIGRWQAQCAAEKAAELGINIDYSIVNSARASLYRGKVNHYKMFETHPFINELYVVKVSMKDVYGEIYTYDNPFYRVTTKALENDSSKYVTILVYDYLLFHVSVNDTTYEKRYNYFSSLNTSGQVPTVLTDKDGTKINVLDLTINDLKKKGSINPSDYNTSNWHNSNEYLTTAY